MKFIDEVIIEVEAGDGGDGGSIYLEASESLNTLIDLRYQRLYRARGGESGAGALKTGKSGEDMIIVVPVGTTAYDADTSERIGELMKSGERLCIAKGGLHGVGNKI